MTITPEIITEQIGKRLELEPYQNGRPTLTINNLRRQAHKGAHHLLRYLNTFRKDLVGYRSEYGIAPNLKTQSALVLHLENIGDPTQLILDTADPESCLAYGGYLFENGATEIWMGTAHDNDMTDVHGTKSAETPLIKGIKTNEELKQVINLLWGKVELDRIRPELLQANLDKNGKQKLEKVANFIPNYYIEKLAKRQAMALEGLSPEQWDNLTHLKQSEYLTQYRTAASESIIKILSGENTWEQLNKNLQKIGQPAINSEDHPLHKVFRQDKNEWQIADIMSTPTSIIIEIPRTQFTHREGDGNGTVKIEFTYENDRPLVICDPQDYKYLSYIINSAHFFKIFEVKCLPKLGETTYYQLEIMLDTNHTKVAFGTDAIAGMPKTRNLNQKIIIPPLSLSKFLTQIDQATFRTPETHTRLIELESALTMTSDLEQDYYHASLFQSITRILSILPMLTMATKPTQKDIATIISMIKDLELQESTYQQVCQDMMISSALSNFRQWTKT